MAGIYDQFANEFQRKIFRVLSYNEGYGPQSESTAYSLSFARDGEPGNKSGYSFGWYQWDLHRHGVASEAYKIVGDAVNNINSSTLMQRATEKGYGNLTEVQVRNSILKQLVDSTGSSDLMVNDFRDLINTELNKQPIRDRIDTQTIQQTQTYENMIPTLLSGGRGSNGDYYIMRERHGVKSLFLTLSLDFGRHSVDGEGAPNPI